MFSGKQCKIMRMTTLSKSSILASSYICLLSIMFHPSAVSSALIPGEEIDCCLENTSYNFSTSLCSDGSEVNLNCSFVYVELPLRDSEDSLKFENDVLKIHSVSDVEQLLSRDTFCIIRGTNNVSTVLICESEVPKLLHVNEFEDVLADRPMWKFYLYTSFMTISGLFCILTILTYGSFSELWNIQDKMIIYAIFSLFIVTMTFNMVHLNPYLVEYYYFCVILAFLLYYFTMTTYFWLNILGFNIWRQIWFKAFCLRDHSLFLLYNIIGWGGPGCFLLVAFITNNTQGSHLKPSFGVASCWFTDVTEIWAYCTGPIAVLLTINAAYISLSSWKLCTDHDRFEQLRYKTLRYRRTMYLKLTIVMGSDWICELFAFILPFEYITIPLDIINALQGVFVFMILVAHRTKVKKILVVKKICGINFPKRWTELPDQEYDTVLSNAMQSVVRGSHWTFFVY